MALWAMSNGHFEPPHVARCRPFTCSVIEAASICVTHGVQCELRDLGGGLRYLITAEGLLSEGGEYTAFVDLPEERDAS